MLDDSTKTKKRRAVIDIVDQKNAIALSQDDGDF